MLSRTFEKGAARGPVILAIRLCNSNADELWDQFDATFCIKEQSRALKDKDFIMK